MQLPSLPKFTLFHGSHTNPALHRRALVNPMREWLIVLSLSIVVLLGGCVYAGLVFYRGMSVTEADVFTGTKPLYSHTQVRDVLTTYEKKEEHFNALRTHAPVPTTTKQVEATSTPVATEETSLPEEEVKESVPQGVPVAQ